MEKRPKRLGEILIEKGLLTKTELEAALKIQKNEGGLIGQILLKNGFVSEGDLANALSQQEEYLYIPAKALAISLKQKILIIGTSLLLSTFPLFYFDYQPFLKNIDRRIYGGLLHLEYILRAPPTACNDIVIVGIDNETVSNMPYRWPYPRSDFAAVIENLKKAAPRVIGIDLAYFGKSAKEDDALLQKALDSNKVILATTINEYGYLTIPDALSFGSNATYGITTKLQDEDGIIRRNLIYLVSKEKKQEGFLFWEMQILKAAKGIDIASIAEKGNAVTFQSKFGEKWYVPVDPVSKSFLIHFRAHTKNFQNISFYHALKGDFDPRLVKNKIVLIGVLPALFQDIQNTSFGFLPGVILNANAFLALYTHDFLKEVPKLIEKMVIIIGVILASIFLLLLSAPKAAMIILLEICLFFVLSYALLVSGYIWNYITFPCAVIICPFLAKKLLNRNFLALITKR
ncbi:MAG: CHASE2 domain-containing protein [Candidatus Omnitrophica bacterium]|nr:CHASE2 domain-containing protein [Candidatus Omnitrophota bacterium]